MILPNEGTPAPRLSLGMVVATQGAIAVIPQQEIAVALNRHARGDWGTVCKEDAEANNDALIHGSRIVSSYKSTTGEKFWIITEADRSVTTILLPSEY